MQCNQFSKFLFLIFLLVPYSNYCQNTIEDFDSLLYSIEKEDIEGVKNFLKKGVYINDFDKHGDTPFSVLCKKDIVNVQIAELLLKYGANSFIENEIDYMSALNYCLSKGHIETIELIFLNTSNDLLKKFFEEDQYIVFSIATGHFESFKVIYPFFKTKIKNDSKIASFVLEEVFNQIIYYESLEKTSKRTGEYKHLDFEAPFKIFQLLIEDKIKLDLLNQNGIPLVFKALQSSKLLKELIEQGVDVNVFRPITSKIDSISLLEEYVEVITKPTLYLNDNPIFMNSIKEIENSLIIFEMLLKKSVDLKTGFNDPYYFLLMKAVTKNNLELTSLLLQKKVIKLNSLDLEGKTLLMRAQEIHSQDMIDLLVRNGCR